ncbi:MAG TPA: zf-HC2 domain-containing protein [Deltaproteobacteria bacterium]|nr:zf-HC2 domain-containing protein [Deltaproteobacteria bacterium]
MNCRICARLLQEYLEDSLSEELINELNTHLKQCRRCEIFFRTYSLTVTLSQRVETPCCVSSEKIKELTSLLHERLFPK